MVRIVHHYTLILFTLVGIQASAAKDQGDSDRNARFIHDVVHLQAKNDGDASRSFGAARNMAENSLLVKESSHGHSQGHSVDMAFRKTQSFFGKDDPAPAPPSEPTAAVTPPGEIPSVIPPPPTAGLPNPRGGDMMGEGGGGDMMGEGGGGGDMMGEGGGDMMGEGGGEAGEGQDTNPEIVAPGPPTVPVPGAPMEATIPTESLPAGTPTVPGEATEPLPAPAPTAQIPTLGQQQPTMDQQEPTPSMGALHTLEPPEPTLDQPTMDQPIPYGAAPSPNDDVPESQPTNPYGGDGGTKPTSPYDGSEPYGDSDPYGDSEPTGDEPYNDDLPPDNDDWDEQPGNNPNDPVWGGGNPPDTYEPPPKPYQPPSDDILDNEDEKKDEDIKDEWEHKSGIQQVEEEAEAVLNDKNLKIIAGACGIVAFLFLLVTAQQLIENPEGCCSKLCRCLVAVFRILCWPCRAMCCSSSRAKDRRTHELMRNDANNYGYSGGSDLELT